MIAQLPTLRDAEYAMRYVAPAGKKEAYGAQALAAVAPFVATTKSAAAIVACVTARSSPRGGTAVVEQLRTKLFRRQSQPHFGFPTWF